MVCPARIDRDEVDATAVEECNGKLAVCAIYM